MKAQHLMILLSLTLIGCGKSGGGGKSTSKIPLQEGEKASTYLDKVTLDLNTPEGLGTLLALKTDADNKRSLGICTWFLVGNNKAMTNSHCIPENLKNNKSLDCSKLLKGKIQTSSGAKTVICKKLLFASKLDNLVVINNDYALMEVNGDLEDTATFKLKRDGVTEGEALSVLSMTHMVNKTSIKSEFTKRHCLMKSSDALGTISSPGASPLAGFLEEGATGDCKSVEGNSGSPAINTNGELIGILHAGLDENAPGLADVTRNVALITNLRCQKFGDSQMDQGYPATCVNERSINALQNGLLEEKGDALVKIEIDKVLAKQPTYLEYDTRISEEKIVTFTPVCVKPEITYANNGQFIRSMVSQFELIFDAKFDYYGNMKMSANLKYAGMVEFEIGDLKTLSTGETKITPILSTGRASRGEKRTIRVCE